MWYPTRKKSAKKVTIKELASHYGVHRHTIARKARGVNLYDFWECVHLVDVLDKAFLGK